MRSEHPEVHHKSTTKVQDTTARRHTLRTSRYCCSVVLLLHLRESGAAFDEERLYTRKFNMGADEYRAGSLPLHVMVTVLQFAVPEIMSPG